MAVAGTPSRPKPAGSRLYIYLGSFFALLALVGFGVFGALSGGGRTGGGQKEIVVALRDISLRTGISPADLQTRRVATDDVPPGAFFSVGDIAKGYVAEIDIKKDQPITTNMLGKSGDLIVGPSPAYLPIAPGYVAVAVPTGEQQGVAGYIQAGDYISVLAGVTMTIFGETGPVASQPVVKTVFTNIHVIKVGPATGQAAGSSAAGGPQSSQQAGVSSSLTVVMTICDAQYFNWFASQTTLKYVLESYHDYGKEPTKADPSCPGNSADPSGDPGVGIKDVDKKYHFTSKFSG